METANFRGHNSVISLTILLKVGAEVTKHMKSLYVIFIKSGWQILEKLSLKFYSIFIHLTVCSVEYRRVLPLFCNINCKKKST